MAFGRYLAQNTFANFDPIPATGIAASRPAVGHEAAAQDSYTLSRALRPILTLDQLAFYTWTAHAAAPPESRLSVTTASRRQRECEAAPRS